MISGRKRQMRRKVSTTIILFKSQWLSHLRIVDLWWTDWTDYAEIFTKVVNLVGVSRVSKCACAVCAVTAGDPKPPSRAIGRLHTASPHVWDSRREKEKIRFVPLTGWTRSIKCKVRSWNLEPGPQGQPNRSISMCKDMYVRSMYVSTRFLVSSWPFCLDPHVPHQLSSLGCNTSV